MRMEGGGASKGMRGEEKEEGEDPKASADPAGNQGREGESKQGKGKMREANIVSYPRQLHLRLRWQHIYPESNDGIRICEGNAVNIQRQWSGQWLIVQQTFLKQRRVFILSCRMKGDVSRERSEGA